MAGPMPGEGMDRRSPARAGLPGLLALAVLALTPASADAVTQYYVSQTGSGTECTQVAPCDIAYPQTVAGSGDETIVEPGTYTVGLTIAAPAGGSIHGVAGEAKPVLIGSVSPLLEAFGTGATATDMVLQATGSADALSLSGNDTVGDRLEATASGSTACTLDAGALLRSSVCHDTSGASNGRALAVISAGATTATARNVTAIADGPNGYGAAVVSFGAADTLTLHSVIASGSGTGADVAASAPTGGTATVDLANSNYATVQPSGTGTTSITPVDSATNQSDAPLFVDDAGADFHEAALSPTIDAGLTEATTGDFDLDGAPRVQGDEVDIGAYEYDATPPEVSIDKGPKKTVKTKHRRIKVTFKFSSPEDATFVCKLDKADYKSCDSPKSYTVGKGKHTFQVRGADANGNTSKPVKKTFTVKRKPKGHHHH